MSDCSTLSGDLKALCEGITESTNDFFLLWAAALVLWMHAGFAMLSAGAVRSKNAKNILMSILMDLTVCAIIWFLVGFAFAYGEDRGGFIGASNFVGFNVGPNADDQRFSFWFFQYCFAATAATIVSGAIAERARFETYLVTSTYMSGWVYPVVVHWVWGGGFLTLGPSGLMGAGVVDFAGCGPVHMVGGLAGMICAKIMGPRMGRYDPETGKPLPMPGHSSALATLGVFILWIGWFGFNPGSVLSLHPGSGSLASRSAVTTILSSSTGALSAMFYASFLSPNEREYDLGMALNGALAGLVSVTGCAAYIEMWAALCIGLIGGLVYVSSSRLMLNTLKIDDPLDATAVHFFTGIWGVFAGAFFVNPVILDGSGFWGVDAENPGPHYIPSGVFYGGNTYKTLVYDPVSMMTIESTNTSGPLGALVASATVEVVSVIAWVVVFTAPYFLLMQHLQLLRVPADIEEVGLDASHHGGGAYPDLFHGYQADEETGKPAAPPASAAPPAAEAPAAETPAAPTELEKA